VDANSEKDKIDNTKKAVAIFEEKALLYQEKFMDVDPYHDSFDVFCSYIKKKNATILELACGPGNVTKYIAEKRPDFEILGTDLSPAMLNLARKNVPSATFELMDSRDLHQVDKKYDGILVGFCLPYLSKEDTLKLIEAASRVLNENGVLYISTMEDDYSKSRVIRPSDGSPGGLYTYFHQAEYLLAYLKQNDFTLLDLSRLDTVQDGGELRDLVLVARKGN
jgi:ubiquinone/menaquinone biosynthesis C-methylase UbiE